MQLVMLSAAQPLGQVCAQNTGHLFRSLQRVLLRYTQLICQASSSGRHRRGNAKGERVEKKNDFDLRGGVQNKILEGCQRSQLCGMPEEGADLITQGKWRACRTPCPTYVQARLALSSAGATCKVPPAISNE